MISLESRMLVALVLALATACGDGGDAAGGATTTDSAKTCAADVTPAAELASPVAMFDADVAPVLAKSCAFSSCHGSKSVTSNHGVFLAASGGDSMTAVKASLLSASKALPSMPYVTPGDPERSFLLHKLDGSLCTLDAQCSGGSCGRTMPQGNDLLPKTSRDAIRRWISQGAK